MTYATDAETAQREPLTNKSSPSKSERYVFKRNLREQIESYVKKQPEYKKMWSADVHLEIEV